VRRLSSRPPWTTDHFTHVTVECAGRRWLRGCGADHSNGTRHHLGARAAFTQDLFIHIDRRGLQR
jgi:hypothetical protein